MTVSKRSIVGLACTLFLVMPIPGSPGAEAEDRYAATVPSSEGPGAVVWAPTVEVARDKAIEACKAKSKTCAPKPSITDKMANLFAYMCCRSPKTACATAADSGFDEAEARVRKIFADAKYSNCGATIFLRASDGSRANRPGTAPVYKRIGE
ncbi:MAG: hypothetical protein MUE84_18170 [Hyphomonas sp.]|nr:hypothetical protein [Hyphomonas sp.]